MDKLKNTQDKLIRFKKISNTIKKGSVLDIGCLRPNPFLKNAIGMDILNVPKHKNYKSIIKGDASKKIPLKDNSIDNIIAGEIIEHLENPMNFVKECYRVLKQNGLLILTTPNIYYYSKIFKILLQNKSQNYNGPKDHIFEIPFYSLKTMLEIAKFKEIKIEGVFFTIPLFRLIIKTKSPLLSKHVFCVGKKLNYIKRP
ncbi:class I SAM-dependent methyltransferase [archaeon]|jgi:SAM-dependent methyltransferase|nr:class I SAM-dependent methyltransferase [archaeon]MBT4022244.1 class I SAM-dependent methyltransferase [archaeon]MBT4460651.1 class I SAM-dependent methyltransferase [archaeon]MBT5424527.1 class I SAM-dependent methyltransferase [archaeon]MBT7439615.1 class I SAM-dependent methyltransferase [archaeon]